MWKKNMKLVKPVPCAFSVKLVFVDKMILQKLTLERYPAELWTLCAVAKMWTLCSQDLRLGRYVYKDIPKCHHLQRNLITFTSMCKRWHLKCSNAKETSCHSSQIWISEMQVLYWTPMKKNCIIEERWWTISWTNCNLFVGLLKIVQWAMCDIFY